MISNKSPMEQLKNICTALEEHLKDSPYSKEAWDAVDEEGKKLRSALKAAKEALNIIANWGEGPQVNGGFDEPHAARTARHALARIEEIL